MPIPSSDPGAHLSYFQADHPEQVEARFSRFNARITQLTPGRLNGRALVMRFEHMTQYALECSQATLAHCRAPEGEVTLLLFDELHGSAYWHDQPYSDRHLIFSEPGSAMVNRSPPGWRGHLFTCDAEQFGAQLAAAAPCLARLTSCVLTPDRQRVDLARRCADQVRTTALEHPRLLGHSRLRATMEHDLLDHLVDALRTSFPVQSNRPRAASRASALKRAEELVIERASEPLSVAELCRHAGVSARTLEYAFMDRYGIGPKAFIKVHRLQKVRLALIAAEPGSTVFEVATDWGFWHMGQFSHDYKKMFGELPSETLRRHQRSAPSDAA